MRFHREIENLGQLRSFHILQSFQKISKNIKISTVLDFVLKT